MPANSPGRIFFYLVAVYIMAKQSKKTQALTRLVGGVRKRGGQGRATLPITASKGRDARERVKSRKLVGKLIENMEDTLESIAWGGYTKNGFKPMARRRIAELAASLPLYEATVNTRYGSLSPLVMTLDYEGIQVDKVALKLYIAELRKYVKILPIEDMEEFLGGCTGTMPVYSTAAEVGRVSELLGDRVPPETQRQVRRIVRWVKTRTPAYIARLIDAYYEHSIFNAKNRLSIRGAPKRRACHISNVSGGTGNVAGRRVVKVRR